MKKIRKTFQSLMPSAYVKYEAPVLTNEQATPIATTPIHAFEPALPPVPSSRQLARDYHQSRLDSWLNSTTTATHARPHSTANAHGVAPAPATGKSPFKIDRCTSQNSTVSSLDPPRDLFRPAPRNTHRLRSVGPRTGADVQFRRPFGSHGPRSASASSISAGSPLTDMYHVGSGNLASSSSSDSAQHTHAQIHSNHHNPGGATHSHSQLQSQSSSSGTGSSSTNAMAQPPAGISRKKIISKSHETGLNDEEIMNEEEEDVWYDKEALFRHHLREVLDKWSSIDDEIWGKVICMEKNRRVAKAYARVPVLTINGGEDGFDGYRIGLSGFDNPKRHPETLQVKKHIGQGIKLKMDNDGNILVRRASSSPVFVRSTTGNFQEDNCFSSEVVKVQGQLEADKPVKVFDMKRFTLNIAKEMKGAYPDRRKLELQCFTSISFVQQEPNHLETPCWIMVINIVALDMLKNKLPSQMVSNGVVNGSQPRMPALMENVSAKRFLSTPRDDHYPRLLQQHLAQQHSLSDSTMPEAGDYADDMDDRASVSTYNFNPGYRASSSMLPGEYSDVMNQAASRRIPLQDAMYRTLEQQHYQDAYYADMANLGAYGHPHNFTGAPGYLAPLGQHSATEPNFKQLRDPNGLPVAGIGAGTGRSFATPALQRFAPQHRHSRSYDSGLESDMTSSSDETDYNRWTCYSRMHMMPHGRGPHGQPPISRLPEWE